MRVEWERIGYISHMNKIKISYFAQIRNFKENQIPLSTAHWDPKWYHNFTGDYNRVFLDKNNRVLGIRINMLSPGKECDNLCRGADGIGSICNGNSSKCKFLNAYRRQLNKITKDEFELFINNLSNKLEAKLHRKDFEFIILVYETPDNLCSERVVIKEWYKNLYNEELEEFSKYENLCI